MSPKIETDILNYYHSYCELTIWFKKIVLRANPKQAISIEDITKEFILERDRILLYVPSDRRRGLKAKLNKIATAYYSRVDSWSKNQKITIDMV